MFKNKKILTYGTYDLLHNGHIKLLKRAKEIGDYLVVGLSTDYFNELKNKKAYYSYEERKELLESIKYVDLVIEENDWKQKIEDIKKYEIDVFVMGNDWEGKFDYLKEYCEVVYLERTEGISTSKIKSDLKEFKVEK
ncbi:MAG: glycerol-3-phosphate cytidylyltransferase [Cetobacterium sp.]